MGRTQLLPDSPIFGGEREHFIAMTVSKQSDLLRWTNIETYQRREDPAIRGNQIDHEHQTPPGRFVRQVCVVEVVNDTRNSASAFPRVPREKDRRCRGLPFRLDRRPRKLARLVQECEGNKKDIGYLFLFIPAGYWASRQPTGCSSNVDGTWGPGPGSL